MKKGKLNPDRYKVIGGAPVEQEANKLSRTRSNRTTKSSGKSQRIPPKVCLQEEDHRHFERTVTRTGASEV